MSSCADALVDAGIIEDDNMNCVNKITAAYGGVDKLNPRAEYIQKAGLISPAMLQVLDGHLKTFRTNQKS